MRATLFSSIALLFSIGISAQEIPTVNDPELKIELYASEPLIQQPIGMTFDTKGGLLVIESHTHFRPKNWSGPEHDQIVRFMDSNGDGKADKREVVFDQTDMTMDIATHPDGAIYLSTRDEVLRLRDADGDGKMEQIDRKLVWLETEGKYPHNGLSGIAFDANGNGYLGMGENLGAAYTIKGADGTELSDEGDGGNIWKFDKNGKRLKRIATGFWNAFGVCVDAGGNVFATDNDPDSAPPCRLHHVVEGGDYGYQFRYGRSGTHPFVSWKGDRLGTIPMISGTGEAPCDIISYRPEGSPEFSGLSNPWHGTLLVASWADHRIESYSLKPSGATFQATPKVFIQGGADFRPVAFAVAPDGSLFISDWVKRSYELHGHGRIWRVSAKAKRILTESPAKIPSETAASKKVEEIRSGPSPSPQDALMGMATDDPHLMNAWIDRLSHEAVLTKQLATLSLVDARQRAGLLLAGRRGLEREGITGPEVPDAFDSLLGRALSDSDPRLVLLALHWTSDWRNRSHLFKIKGMLSDPTVQPDIYHAAITALARIENTGASESDIVKRLKTDVSSPELPITQRLLALKSLPKGDAVLSVAELESMLNATSSADTIWLINVLGLNPDPAKHRVLRRLAFDPRQKTDARAAAISHLNVEDEDRPGIVKLAGGSDPILQRAALQSLRGQQLKMEEQTALKSLQSNEHRAMVQRILGLPFSSPRRPQQNTDRQAWRAHLHNLEGEPNLENGRRVFLSPKLGGCTACHQMEGLGNTSGPDLTQMGESASKDSVLESLLTPSKNVAPQWETFVISTSDGKTRTGFQMAERGSVHTYADLTGQTFEIKIDDIVKRERLPISIMPEGLVNNLTDEEIRDLIAYLGQKRQ